MLLKNVACSGLSSLLYFNVVDDFINFLCETVTYVVKNFARDVLSLLLNFVQDFINCMFATVTDVVKISPAAGLCHSCVSISFTILFIICMQTVTNVAKKFRLWRAFGTHIFRFRVFLSFFPRNLFLPTPLAMTNILLVNSNKL